MTGAGCEAPWHAWLSRSGGWHMIEEIDLVPVIALQCDWLRLCERLEVLADRLPGAFSEPERTLVCAELSRLADAPHDVFVVGAQALFVRQEGEPLAHSLIGHVARRHAARIVQAHDLIETLDLQTPHAPDAETLGYMLRCFFEGCRQVVALERLTLLELGAERLTASARALLTERIIECCEIV